MLKLMRSRTLTACLSLFVITLSIYYGAVFEMQHHVDQELARLRAAGVPYRLEQLDPTQVPSARNAMPYYLAAMALNHSSVTDSSRLVDDWNHIDAALASSHRAEIDSRLQDMQPTFTLLQLGYQKPDCAYQFHPEDGLSMRMPDFVSMRNMSLIVALQSFVDMEHGQNAQAVDASTWMLCFLQRFHYGGSLIEQMVRLACADIVLQPLQRLASQGVRGHYAELLQQIDALQGVLDGSLTEANNTERAMALDAFRQVAENQVSYRDTIPNDAWQVELLYRLGGRPLLLWDEWTALEHYAQFADGLRNGRPELLQFSPTSSGIGQYRVSNILLPNMRRAWEQTQTMSGRLHQLRTALAALNTP